MPRLPLAGLLGCVILGALAFAAGTSASPNASRLGPPTYVVGATEDEALGLDDGGALVYTQMHDYGLGVVRMNVTYDRTQPTTIPQEDALERAIVPAIANGIRVMLSIAPAHNNEVTGDPNGVKDYAAYAALVARTFPLVTDFIIGNEPNLGRFWSPTYNADGTIAAGATYEATLAAAYDALKAVNPAIDVIGLAVSPRGDDRPGSARLTISPVRFINAVGAAYRKSGRRLPIMDNAALHPYPNVNTDPPDKGYPWPNAGVPNLDRAQQAFWDAFHGTGQPTFDENALAARSTEGLGAPPVKWILDEAGWQTNTQNVPGYTGSENVPTVDEATQAEYHSEVVSEFACDPHVAALLFFHWVDETDRDRFQTGALHSDDTVKPAAAAVESAIAAGCTGPTVFWRHSTDVDGAAISGGPRNGALFFVNANEDATFIATATPTKKWLRTHPRANVLTATGSVKAYAGKGVKIPGVTVGTMAGFRITVKLAAAMNPARTTTLTR
jgi:hypothetical protein